MTNGDKIFKAVIEDSALISYGGYNPDDYDSLQNALDDENVVISTVAKIIYYQLRGHSMGHRTKRILRIERKEYQTY